MGLPAYYLSYDAFFPGRPQLGCCSWLLAPSTGSSRGTRGLVVLILHSHGLYISILWSVWWVACGSPMFRKHKGILTQSRASFKHDVGTWMRYRPKSHDLWPLDLPSLYCLKGSVRVLLVVKATLPDSLDKARLAQRGCPLLAESILRSVIVRCRFAQLAWQLPTSGYPDMRMTRARIITKQIFFCKMRLICHNLYYNIKSKYTGGVLV